MNSDSNSLIVKLDGRFGPMYRRQIESTLQRELARPVDVEAISTNLEQHLDVGTAASLVSMIIAIVSLLIQVKELHDKSPWTVAKINESLLETAARTTGSGNLSNFRYTGINEFLSNQQTTCEVLVDIDDEDYRFTVEQDGNTIFVKL